MMTRKEEIAAIEQHIQGCLKSYADKGVVLSDTVNLIIKKWFNANNSERNNSTLDEDFHLPAVESFEKNHRQFIQDIRWLCDQLEEKINNPANDPLAVEVERHRYGAPAAKSKRTKLKREPFANPSSAEHDLPAANREDSSLSGMFEAVAAQQAKEKIEKEASLLKKKLKEIFKKLLEKEVLHEGKGILREYYDLKHKMVERSTRLTGPQYLSELRYIEKKLNDQNASAVAFIDRVKSNSDKCGELKCLEGIKSSIDASYQQYTAGENAPPDYKGLCYEAVFRQHHSAVLVIQEQQKNTISTQYEALKRYQSFPIIKAYYENDAIDLDDPRNSKLIEEYGYLKRLLALEQLKNQLEEANKKAIAQIEAVEELFNQVFDQNQLRSLQAFYLKQNKNRTMTDFCKKFQQEKENYQREVQTNPYVAIQYEAYFETARLQLSSYQNVLENSQYKTFLAGQVDDNKVSSHYAYAAKEKIRSFYEAHPYLCWALIGAGTGLLTLGVIAGIAGLTLLTGGMVGVAVGGFFATLLAVKLGGGAAAAATAGASIAVTSHAIRQQCCSTARLNKRLQMVSVDTLDSLPEVSKEKQNTEVTPLRPSAHVTLREPVGAPSTSGLRLPRGFML